MNLTTEQQEIVAAVREFVDKDVVPFASDLEHADVSAVLAPVTLGEAIPA